MKKEKVISSFRGELRFLSNFYPALVLYEGWHYASVEHAFQAAKSMDWDDRRLIRAAETPGRAKALGHEVRLRPDWERVKRSVMFSLVIEKFTRYSNLGYELQETHPAILIEGNDWGDEYWGQVQRPDGRWKGENHLGKILMEVRERVGMTLGRR